MIEPALEVERGLLEDLAGRIFADVEGARDPETIRGGADLWEVVEIVLVRTPCLGDVADDKVVEERLRIATLGLKLSFVAFGSPRRLSTDTWLGISTSRGAII